MLLPLSLWGQHNGILGDRLRNEALKASEEIPAISVLFNFAERYLGMLRDMDNAERSSRMQRDDVRILKGSVEALARINDKTSWAFAEKNDRYNLLISNSETPLIEMSVPASCQLLTGKNLKELERDFFAGLDNYSFRVVDTLSADVSECEHLHGNYYLKPGESYQIKEINSNLYLENVDNSLQLVFDVDHPAESCHNLLLLETCPADVLLQLVVRKYGLKKEERTLPLRLWLSYLKVLGCNIYIGVEEMNADHIRVAFFAVNTIMRFNHIMNAEVPYSIFKDGKGTVKGDLNTFIPTHNISALFDELNQHSGGK